MYLNNSKQIVIKIGSSLLIDNNKNIRKKWLFDFAKDIKNLVKNKKKIIIVSSGAIALGCKKLNISKKNLKIDKSQAVASIGQIELMNLFNEIFKKSKLNLSQILLTLEDTEVRRRAINAKRTLDNLFDLGFIPLVNENDSIATSEIKYGDNDRLASRVAQISRSDCLILLSDVDGLFDKNPKLNKTAKLINEVKKVDGQKRIVQRQFSDADMDLLYDGIKLDGIKNALPNLSFIPGIAISDLVITKGGHYKLTASQGAINSIPIVSYKNKFSINIEQNNESPDAGVNGYASLGYKYGTLNGSLAGKEFAIGYKDANRSEIFTNLSRNTYNIAYTNAKNLDVRFMSFNNLKKYLSKRPKRQI